MISCSKKILLVLSFVFLTHPVYAADGSAYYQRGVEYLRLGQYAEAASELEAYNRLQTEDLKGLQALAEVYLLLNKLSLASAALEAAHKLERNDVNTHLLKGRLYLQSQEPDKARAHFRTLLFLNKADGEAYYWLAQAEFALGHQPEALDALAKAQKDRGISPEFMARSLLLEAKLLPDAAEQKIKIAQDLQGLPADIELMVREQWVHFLVSQGRTRELIADKQAEIEALLAKNPEASLSSDFKQLHSYLALASNDADELFFLKTLEKLNENHPLHMELRQELVRNFLHLQRFEYLLAFYQWELFTFSRRWDDPTKAAAFHRIGDVHLRLGAAKLAFDNYERAVVLAPTDTVARRRMGLIYLSAGDAASAQKEFKTVLQQDPLDRQSRLLYALALAFAGQKQQSEEVLQQLPADYGGDLRERVLASLALPNPRPEASLWKSILLDEEILNIQEHLLTKITFNL